MELKKFREEFKVYRKELYEIETSRIEYNKKSQIKFDQIGFDIKQNVIRPTSFYKLKKNILCGFVLVKENYNYLKEDSNYENLITNKLLQIFYLIETNKELITTNIHKLTDDERNAIIMFETIVRKKLLNLSTKQILEENNYKKIKKMLQK